MAQERLSESKVEEIAPPVDLVAGPRFESEVHDESTLSPTFGSCLHSYTCATYCRRHRRYCDAQNRVPNSVPGHTQEFEDFLNSSAFLLKSNTF